MLAREFRSTKWLAIPFYPAPGKNAAACWNNLGHKFMWEIGLGRAGRVLMWFLTLCSVFGGELCSLDRKRPYSSGDSRISTPALALGRRSRRAPKPDTQTTSSPFATTGHR